MKPLALAIIAAPVLAACASGAPVLDADKLLNSQDFWINEDFDWDKRNVPMFDCPDQEINTTYYYRWELVTRHLVYGNPNHGYAFTELCKV